MMLFLLALNVGFAQSNIPEPVFIVEESKGTQAWNIERVAGCFGDLKEARGNVLPAVGRLAAPLYQTSSFTKGVFALTEPTCILGEQPEAKASFTDFVMDFETYLFNFVYECGCGSCYTLDPDAEYGVGEEFGEDEVLSRVTEQHKKDYAAYKARRTPEVAANKVQHGLYSTEYDDWRKRYESSIHDESVRISITPDKDMTDGVVTLYNFNWEHQMWCGDTSDVRRQGLQNRTVNLPTLKKGETVHIWLHNVDSQLSWGAVLHSKDDAESIVPTLEREAERRLGSSESDVYGLPPDFQGRAVELPPGTKALINDDCCAC